jgi:N-methylhydantoinase A
MGGTSFDVSIIHGGKPAYSFISNTDQYEYFLPKVDLQAIGAGGGSLVRVHPETRTMTVGPDSAGAFPGPVCYGRGGTVPTVTDAQLVLGYLDPDNFAGGRMQLDRAAAVKAIESLGKQIGMTAAQCAAGICRIVELQMADVIRKVTVEKGYDPREFVLFAFGGAGPAHAGVFAAELGVRKVIVPQRKAASAWCAFGAAAADVLHIFEHTEIMPTPVAVERINRILQTIQSNAEKLMASEGIAAQRQRFEFSLDLRHKGQINEVEVLLPWTRLPADYEPALRRMFVERYEKLYGRGSALAGAQLEIVVCRLRARALTPRPKLNKAKKSSKAIPKAALRKPRQIYWSGLKKTPVYDGEKLVAGNTIKGPAIVETSDTAVVVHPGRVLRLDTLGNFEITFK